MDTASRFVIVGGGTAGWLAALVLSDAATRAGRRLSVTVVESPKIPTIGVGEGTTAIFKSILDYFSIDETAFLRETKGTIKYGIRHRDWAALGTSYDGPIDDPHALIKELPARSEVLNIYATAAGRPLADIHLFGYLMKAGKAPYIRTADGGFQPVSPFQYAYHIDNTAVGLFLRRHADQVTTVSGTVIGADRNPDTGDLTRLNLEEGGSVDGDFFVDCTGFRRRLIGDEMGGGWVSYADQLPVNRAMPFWLPHPSDAEISPVTLAWAQQAGWMWQIPTFDRLGCGYVYSDDHLTPDQAQAEIESTLGQPIEPRADLKFDVGRADNAWIGNCLAVGLAQSFLEPLEATSIHGSLVQLMLFSQEYMRETDPLPAARSAYNSRVARQLDDFRNFINLHYVTRRDDTPFWRDTREACLHPEVRARLEQWSTEMPKAAHFEDGLSGLPHIESQLYYPVLDGLGLLKKSVARQEMKQWSGLRQQLRAQLDHSQVEFRRAAEKAISHRAYLEAIAAG